MPANPLVGVLTPQIRQILYVTYFAAALVAGILEVIYDPEPRWLQKGQEVLAYLAAALTLTAASNIAKTDRQQDAPAVRE